MSNCIDPGVMSTVAALMLVLGFLAAIGVWAIWNFLIKWVDARALAAFRRAEGEQ